MTTVTESDLRELKDLIKTLGIELDKKIDQRFNELDKKIDQRFNEADKKNLELSGKIDITNAKLEALDKRLTDGLNNIDKRVTNQEFIYRSVFIGIIGLIATSLGTSAVRYFWNNPIFPLH